MAKAKTVFYCTSCGNETPKWQGKCPACGAWNTMQEHIEKPTSPGRPKISGISGNNAPKSICEVHSGDEIRFLTGMGELDRVLGGGAVKGSLVLVGGAEPEHYQLMNEPNLRPIINVQPTEESVFEALEQLVLHPDFIPGLKRDSIAYVKKHHDHIAVAQSYLQFWGQRMNI